MSPLQDYPSLRPGLQMLYVWALNLGQIPVLAYLTFSGQVFYPTYETAPRLVPLTPLADQQLGGMFMKVAGMSVLFAMFAMAFWRWYRLENITAPASSGGCTPRPESLPLASRGNL